MNSTKCFECGFVGWSDAGFCKGCGVDLSSGSGRKLRSGLAIWSLVLGILGFFTFGLLGVGAVVGTILGFIALSRANKNPSKYGGRGMAIAGLVLCLSSFVIAVPIGVIAAIAIPNLLAARRAANEASSLATLRRIYSAEASYYDVYERYGTLKELCDENLITETIASGTKSGYRFSVQVVERDDYPTGFEVVSVPVTYPNSGRRSFYIDETGVIRGADNSGGAASKFDSPLDFDSDYGEMNRRPASYEPAGAN
jgi:hypothetical protein